MSTDRIPGEVADKVVKIRRCAAVVKGGRRFSFSALVVVGDRNGKVACGYGKANEVPPSVEKAVQDGKRNMVSVNLARIGEDAKTIPHAATGTFGSAKVVLIPARPGTGVIAGAAVRDVCDLAGITDILTKCYGSTNPTNLVKATIDALVSLRSKDDVKKLRGVEL